MKRIERLRQLRGCGVFRDFAWPSDLSEFGRYNLIYGWNGTGKTTLSRLLRDLELNQPPRLGEAVLRINGSDVRGENFPHSILPVRVFNRDFIRENVFPVVDSDMPPILVLGAESVEKQKDVERLTEQRATAQGKLESARATAQAAETQFDNFCRDRAKFIKDTLRASGQSRYNNYDKSDFKADAMSMADAADDAPRRLADTEREKLLAQHHATPKPKVTEIAYALPNISAIMKSLSELLTTTVVSEAIEALKTDAPLAAWTREGLALHQGRNAALCQFCEQPLPRGRIARLENHFNDQYERFIQRIDKEIDQQKATSEASASLQLPAKAELYDDLGLEFQSRKADLKEALQLAQDFADASVQVLEAKKSRAFKQVDLQLKGPAIDASVIVKLNAVIRKHNDACDDFADRVNEARNRLAADAIAAKLEEFMSGKDAVRRTKVDAKEKKQEVHRLESEITKLEREIVEHRQPAEELNEDLRKYLGHNELCLEVKENGYAMTRGGVPAKSLSEGEATAIALLYFLKSLNDRRFALESGVIVLDDPVSSLDANALFLAFGFIRERTEAAGQLFVLTHNFSFFRQVRNWFHRLKGQNKQDVSQRPARFFMLDHVLMGDARSSTIRWLDPLLEQYESEYHYLFARVHRASTELAPPDLEHNYVLPNIARRMLEAFLAFRLPQVSGNLWQQLKAIQFDESKKIRIYRFLNTHSHSIAVGEPEHDLSALAEGPAVLKDLLEMMESLDDAHYSAMVQLVAPPVDALEQP